MAIRRYLQFLLMSLCLAIVPTLSLADESVLKLDSAEFVLDNAESPPPDSAPWKPQSLPDNWRISRPNVGGFVWYRIHFTLPRQPDHPYAIYLPRLILNAAFYVNRAYLGSGGQFEDPVSRNWNRAQYYLITPTLLQSGTNTVSIRLWSYANDGLLLPVSVGPEAELRPRFEHRYFLQTTLVQLVSWLAAVISFLVLFLWFRRPKDSFYGYVGCACLFSAIQTLYYVVRDAPLPGQLWDIVAVTSFFYTCAFGSLFVLRFTNLRWPRFERLIWVCVILSPIGLLLGTTFAMGATLVSSVLALINIVIILILIGVLSKFWWRQPTTESALLLVVFVNSVIIGIYDLLMFLGFISMERLFLAAYAPALGAIVLGCIVINRFVDSMNDFEKLNVELESRVEQKHAELEANYQHMQQLERESAAVEERQRIMRDMHDGLGAQLISTLSLVEHGDLAKEEVAAVLRECLDDLRLTIDSLESTENDLLTVLGNFRYRLEPRLNSHGITLDWQVRDVPQLACLTPRNVLHILRILQEAFTNILKHAHANIVKVQTGVATSSAAVFVSVSDNGVGMTGDHHGHGLANMRRRAQAIGAMLDIATTSTGTMITLSLPSA